MCQIRWIALQSAGANIVQHPIAASDWGRTLQQIGYQKITPEFNNPQPGDIYIIHRTKNIVMDILQVLQVRNGFLILKTSYDVYKDPNVTYSILPSGTTISTGLIYRAI